MVSILIIGDSCRDEFIYGECNRLAPEAPVPVFNVVNTVSSMGMAGNVYRNLKELIDRSRVDISVDILTNSNWIDVTKTRYVDKTTNHMFIRIDDKDHKIERIHPLNLIKIKDYDFIIISDYNKGFVTEQDIEYICQVNPNVIIDTKKILGSWINKTNFLKVNTSEYQKNKDYIDKFLSKKTLVTMGSKGCTFNGAMYPVSEVDVKDTAGAGDSFLAGFVFELARTGNIDNAIRCGNDCATEVVQKRGVSII